MSKPVPTLEEIQEKIYQHTRTFVPCAVLLCIQKMLKGEI